MPDNKERRPFGFLRRLCGGFSGFFRFAARFQRFCILLFNALLLPKREWGGVRKRGLSCNAFDRENLRLPLPLFFRCAAAR